MTDPTRLVSTPESELERALLTAGRSYGASSSVRTNTLLALGLTAVGTTVAPSAAAASSSLSKAALSKVALALLAIGVAVPAYRYFNRTSGASVTSVAHPSAVGTASVLSLPSAALEPSAAAPAAPVEAQPVEAARVETAEPLAATKARSSGNARAEPKPVSDPPLTAELAALDAARSSLSHSDPSAALSALDGYARNFPRGRLKLEAEVLRIGALSKSGQTEAARKRAQTFLRLHPDSVLASRVRSYAGL